MVGSTARQTACFLTLLLGFDALRIEDKTLDTIDPLLDDDELVDAVRQVLAKRSPKSAKTGRVGIAPDRLLRTVVLEHVKGLSFRQLERELCANLAYRRFTRFDLDPVPDHTTLNRNFGLLGEDVIAQIHARVVNRARQEHVATGRRMRTDTTAVETNIHHPTDSSLLQDSIRVLTRLLQRISDQCATGTLKVVDHSRAATRRVLEINRAAKSFTDAARARMKKSYRKLVRLTVSLAEQAQETIENLTASTLRIQGRLSQVVRAQLQLEHYLPLIERVIAQTKARVFDGNTRFPHKVLSLFEEHSLPIRKGKAAKPTEFGRLVRLDEVENGIISNFEICAGQPADDQQLIPAIEAHEKMFGRVPEAVAADRGCASAKN